MSDITLPDFDDPCDVYKKLRQAHHLLLTGQSAASIRYTSGGGQTEEATFFKADISALQAAMAKARAECQAKQDGGKPKRYAVSAGGKRW